MRELNSCEIDVISGGDGMCKPDDPAPYGDSSESFGEKMADYIKLWMML
jgi:hypothetical protein